MRNIRIAAVLALILVFASSGAAARQKSVRVPSGPLPKDPAAKIRFEYEQTGRQSRASGFKLQY